MGNEGCDQGAGCAIAAAHLQAAGVICIMAETIGAVWADKIDAAIICTLRDGTKREVVGAKCVEMAKDATA